MFAMFDTAIAFDQDIGAWDIINVEDMRLMFDSVTLSTSNYDNILSSWSTKSLQSDVEFDAGGSKYNSSSSERQSIIDSFNWTINDGGHE
jgi:hypothetical protein